MSDEKINVKISINRFWGSSEGVHIDIEDSNSGIQIMQIEVDFQEFAKALMGSSNQPATITRFAKAGINNLGKFPARKTIYVAPNFHYSDRKDKKTIIENAIEKYKKSGWRYFHDQLGNSHYKQGNGYPIYLVKYYDTAEEAIKNTTKD